MRSACIAIWQPRWGYFKFIVKRFLLFNAALWKTTLQKAWQGDKKRSLRAWIERWKGWRKGWMYCKSISILVVVERGLHWCFSVVLIYLRILCWTETEWINRDNWNELGKLFPTTHWSNSIRFYSEWKGSSDGRWEVARGSRWWLAGWGCRERDSLSGSCCQKSHPVVHPKHTDLTICALCSLVMSFPLPSCHPKRSGIGANRIEWWLMSIQKVLNTICIEKKH